MYQVEERTIFTMSGKLDILGRINQKIVMLEGPEEPEIEIEFLIVCSVYSQLVLGSSTLR